MTKKFQFLLTAMCISLWSLSSFAQSPQQELENIAFAVGKNFGSIKGEKTEGGFASKLNFSTADYTIIETDKAGNAHHLKIAFKSDDASVCQKKLERLNSTIELSLPIVDFEKKQAKNEAFVNSAVTVYEPRNTDTTKFRVEVGVVQTKNGFEGVILYYPL